MSVGFSYLDGDNKGIILAMLCEIWALMRVCDDHYTVAPKAFMFAHFSCLWVFLINSYNLRRSIVLV
jgi:hypothetical protein